jgi:hypothetical protein
MPHSASARSEEDRCDATAPVVSRAAFGILRCYGELPEGRTLLPFASRRAACFREPRASSPPRVPESKTSLIAIADCLIEEGADAVVLGCTELPLLLEEGDLSVPVLDTTRLHADAALEAAIA